MDPLTILAAVRALAELTRAAPGLIEQARIFMDGDGDPGVKSALATAMASYEADHPRVIEKLRAASQR